MRQKADSDNPTVVNPALSATARQANADNVRDIREVNLASFLTDRNRLDEAELILRTVLRRVLARQGLYHVRSGPAIREFAEVLTAQGRYSEATIMARAAVVSYEAGGAVLEANGLAFARRGLARSLVLDTRWSEALAVFEQMRDGLAADPESLAAYGRVDACWGLALLKSNRARDAVSLLGPRVEQDRKVLGETHPQLALMRGVLGMALAASGERRRALSEFQAAITAMLAAGFDRTAAELPLIRHILEGYIGLLLEIGGMPFEREANIDATSEAFRLADLTRGQSVQGAVASVAARASAADPAIAALARKEQDLGNLMQALNGYLLNHVSLRPEEQSPNVIAELQKRVEQMRAERRQVRDELQKRFPRYADLVNPRPATLDQARAVIVVLIVV